MSISQAQCPQSAYISFYIAFDRCEICHATDSLTDTSILQKLYYKIWRPNRSFMNASRACRICYTCCSQSHINATNGICLHNRHISQLNITSEHDWRSELCMKDRTVISRMCTVDLWIPMFELCAWKIHSAVGRFVALRCCTRRGWWNFNERNSKLWIKESWHVTPITLCSYTLQWRLDL